MCCRVALVLVDFQPEKKAETKQTKMELKNASLRKADMTIARKMELNNASLRKSEMTIAKQNGIEKCKSEKGEHDRLPLD